ncbi:glycosyltransferase family 39 protein [Patescibacteria group bacterium]|nr:glycosyltransferase family 39 protein [Patescibacteria group bacterium]
MRIWHKIAIVAVLLLALFLIVFKFTEIPRVWIDEGIFTEVSKNLAWHGQQGIQIAPGQIESSAVVSTSGYPLIFSVAASFKIFGVGLWQARLPMLIFMFALVFLFFFFTKKQRGVYWAIFSVLLLLSFSPFYGNGRPVQGEVPGLVFLLLGSLLFLRWEEKLFNNKWLALFSGLAFGLSAATKPLFLIILVPTLIISIIILRKVIDGKNLILFSGGFLSPVIIWLFVQFPNLNLFKKAISAYISGNSISSVSSLALIKSNFISFFTESTPALFMLLLVFSFFVFAYFYVFQKKRFFSWAEFVIFLFVVINWLAYLKGPNWYRHFFPANVLVFLLFCSAISVLWNQIQAKFIKKIILITAIGLMVFQFYHLVFLSDNSFLKKSNQNSLLSQAFSEIGPDKTVFFYNSIATTVFLEHNNYYQYFTPTDYLEFGKDSLNNLSYDYIVGGDIIMEKRFDRSCYVKIEAGKCFIFKRISDCKAI